ncbi:MAG TPA: lysophospholipid acyltransferase family protein [Candidatus Acidoferrum sp.]|nr:lysophospholipid acyltransferase family protein [Candidatus Acidoferrum sp.]
MLKRLKRNVVYFTVRAAMIKFNLLPRWLAVGSGGFVGWVAWACLPRDRARMHEHLRMAFGNSLTVAQRRRIGRRFFVNSGKNLVDVLRFKRHYAHDIKPNLKVEGLEHFDKAYKAGHGLIGVTGHIGNFELLAVHMASLGYRIAVIGRELYDPRLDALLVENRASMGLTNLATTDSPKKYLSWLKGGGALGVLIDTDSMRVRSMFVPALGRLSNTPVGQTILGLRAGSAFLPMACVREPGNRYKIIIKPAIEYQLTQDFEADVKNVTALCTKELDEIIRAYPDQWIWIHNRWNTRPPDTP